MSLWLPKTPVRQLSFKKRFIAPILEGRKTSTLRLKSHVTPGDMVKAICRYHEPPFAQLQILSVDRVHFAELSEGDAIVEGFQALDELQQEIKNVYPGLTIQQAFFRIQFKLIAEEKPPL
jgi:hypothetical protein